ncbi:Hsp20/alpha crystallin family protein [Natronococcus sp. A-GB7]|uniref:gas vesicle protein GvpH n=1 Tax=Natronococcus sp. A-GB7 TaxID=3037649 RepID=UPI00241D1F00|nr:Hsp20/alpha crystallin family protein [Natronococcus sp. A-GB7]MDG5818711.1 Hsp20/alpha crystallin family protein [Natronococcus sp. A-GB7]
MSNKDENERDDSERKAPVRDNQQRDPSLATAIESSLQAGLRSLSEGLEKVVGEDAKRSSRGPPRSRPPARRTRANQRQRTDDQERSRARTSGSTDCLIDTRRDDGEFVVIADLPGADKDDLTAGIDPRTNELVIRKTGTTVGRVELPWTSSEMQKAWFKNGVLEVYIRSDDTEQSEKSVS